MKLVRWILVLPIAILSPLVVITLLNLGMFALGSIDWRWSFSAEKSVPGLIAEYAVFWGIFVFAGVLTAPSGKKNVAVILTLFPYLYLLAQAIAVLLYPEMIASKLPIVYGIAGAIAASLALREVFRDESLSFLQK